MEKACRSIRRCQNEPSASKTVRTFDHWYYLEITLDDVPVFQDVFEVVVTVVSLTNRDFLTLCKVL